MEDKHEKKAIRIATLLAGYMRDTLTSAEHDELDEWVGASARNMNLFEELTDARKVQLALDLLNDKVLPVPIDSLDWDYEKHVKWYKPKSFKIKIGTFASIVFWIFGLSVAAWISLEINRFDSFVYGSFFGMSFMHLYHTKIKKINPSNTPSKPEFDYTGV